LKKETQPIRQSQMNNCKNCGRICSSSFSSFCCDGCRLSYNNKERVDREARVAEKAARDAEAEARRAEAEARREMYRLQREAVTAARHTISLNPQCPICYSNEAVTLPSDGSGKYVCRDCGSGLEVRYTGEVFILGSRLERLGAFEDREIRADRPCIQCRHFRSEGSRKLQYYLVFSLVLLFLYLIGFLVFGGWIWGVAGGVGLLFLGNYFVNVPDNDQCTNKAPQKDPHVHQKLHYNRDQNSPCYTLNPNWQCRFFESKDVRS
jgi:hypothetical protein